MHLLAKTISKCSFHPSLLNFNLFNIDSNNPLSYETIFYDHHPSILDSKYKFNDFQSRKVSKQMVFSICAISNHPEQQDDPIPTPPNNLTF